MANMSFFRETQDLLMVRYLALPVHSESFKTLANRIKIKKDNMYTTYCPFLHTGTFKLKYKLQLFFALGCE